MIGQNPKAEVAPFFVGGNRDKEISLVDGDCHERMGNLKPNSRWKSGKNLGQVEQTLKPEL